MEEKYCGQPTFYNGNQLVYLGADGICYPVPSQFIGGGGKGGRGSQGTQGSQGPQGAQGVQGYQGTQGAQGFQGSNGTDGGTFAAYIESPDGLALTANQIGGVGPFAYQWGVRSKFIGGTDITFTGFAYPTGPTTQVANINNVPPSYDGTVTVGILDTANGRISFAYWHTRKDSAP